MANLLRCPLLSVKLYNMFMGSYIGGETAGLMHTLASKFFGVEGDRLDYDSSEEQILEHLQKLHGSKSKDNKGGHELQKAYNDLVEHKPSISEDFDSLASYIFKFALNCGETYKRNVEKMKNYISEYCEEGEIVFVRHVHDGALYYWWAEVTGYNKHSSNYGVKVKEGTDQYRELKEIGVCFDIDKVILAIEDARQEREKSMRSRLGTIHELGINNLADDLSW